MELWDFFFGAILISYGTLMFLVFFDKYYKKRPLKNWSKKRMYNCFTYLFWFLGFILAGCCVIELAGEWVMTFWGIGWLLMIFAPCTTEEWNHPPKKYYRGIYFAILGILFISIQFFHN